MSVIESAAEESGEHRVEPLAAGCGRGQAIPIERDKAAFDQRRETAAEQALGRLARNVFEPLPRHPLDEPEAHHQQLLDRRLAVNCLCGFGAGSGRLDRREPPLREAVLLRRRLDPASSQSSMRAGADPEVILIAPIGEVVPAFGTRLSVVGDLVGR